MSSQIVKNRTLHIAVIDFSHVSLHNASVNVFAIRIGKAGAQVFFDRNQRGRIHVLYSITYLSSAAAPVGRTPGPLADPLVGISVLAENCLADLHHQCMIFYRRRLPHLYEIGKPIFLTWRLHDSLPRNRIFQVGSLSSGQAFAALDRLLDDARSGSTVPPTARNG